MITYLTIALIWSVFTEIAFEFMKEELTWEMKLLNFVFFPIIVIASIYNFIKEFNKPL